MASYSLYPPTLNSTASAFVATGTSATCRIFFSLSRFSTSISTIAGVHISIIKQTTGQSVVRKTDNLEDGRFRTTGIIIVNSPPTKVEGEDNLYYIDILNEDVMNGDNVGFYPGWIYKIQIRLSAVQYSSSIGQSAWLNVNAGNFSEWSTYCSVKATGQPVIAVPIFKNFDSSVYQNPDDANEEVIYTLTNSSLDFSGSYSNPKDEAEKLYSYNLKLYDEDMNLLEASDTVYANQFYTPNQFKYLFKKELKNLKKYRVELDFTTINKYSPDSPYVFIIQVNYAEENKTTIYPYTIENIKNLPSKIQSDFKRKTSLSAEEEEGRVGIKIYSSIEEEYYGNLILRRASSQDNFSTWTDIRIISISKEDFVNDFEIIYDYTIESGVFYKYGIQSLDSFQQRGVMNINDDLIIRNFQFSFLLGQDNKQLKLQFNNVMNSFNYTYLESKVDTIGGQYPYITRNGNTKYRTFPITGLISYNMDENFLFCSEEELYQYKAIAEKYKEYNKSKGIGIYDYKKELIFREKVIEFLQDGKPKLFKSPSEGNIIIRLMNVSEQPNQTLNRMIYSFTSTAYEIAAPTMENYKNYSFYNVGEFVDFSLEKNYEQKIGQFDEDINVGEDLITQIWKKYDMSSRNQSGLKMSLEQVSYLSVEFNSPPMRVINNAGEMVLGYQLKYNNTIITINAKYGNIYYFDENLFFSSSDSLIVPAGVDNIPTISVTLNFVYKQSIEDYVGKVVESRTYMNGIAQVFDSYEAGTDIYRELYYKYYVEWELEFRRLNEVEFVCVEAEPGAVFKIRDDSDYSTFDINYTGVLNLSDLGNVHGLIYLGKRQPDGTIDNTKKCDMMIDYIYHIIEGTYEEG